MNKGFTLIELLITVSIIAILSTIGLTFFKSSLISARDGTRKQDLLRLATALEVYFQQNHSYIPPTSNADATCERDTALFYDPRSGIAPLLTTNIVPIDPLTKTNYCYVSVSGQGFRLFAKLENCKDPEIIPNIDCQTAQWNYTVVSDNLNPSD